MVQQISMTDENTWAYHPKIDSDLFSQTFYTVHENHR